MRAIVCPRARLASNRNELIIVVNLMMRATVGDATSLKVDPTNKVQFWTSVSVLRNAIFDIIKTHTGSQW